MARAVWNIATSMLTRSLTRNKSAIEGIGIVKTHVWKARAGLLDMDLNVHVNNSSYLYQMELARWHLSGLSGMLDLCFKRRWMLLVGSQSIRYRRSIGPFQAYEVHSDIIFWDETWFYFCHRFVCPHTGLLFAEGLTRGLVKDSKRKTLSFETVAKEMKLELPEQKPMPDVVKAFLEWDAATKASTADWNPENYIDRKVPSLLKSVNLVPK